MIRANKPDLVVELAAQAKLPTVRPSVHDVLVAMGPNQAPRWTTLIDPDGGDLVEARRIAEHQFGKDRVLKVNAREGGRT